MNVCKRDPQEWMFRSHKGFLSEGEHLKDVLKGDWQTVQALGTTHIELANHIKAIISAASVFVLPINLILMWLVLIWPVEQKKLVHCCTFPYDAKLLPQNTLRFGGLATIVSFLCNCFFFF